MVEDVEPEIRDPDIAFWFDEENPGIFEVKINEGVEEVQFLLAYHYLLKESLKFFDNTLLSFTKED